MAKVGSRNICEVVIDATDVERSFLFYDVVFHDRRLRDQTQAALSLSELLQEWDADAFIDYPVRLFRMLRRCVRDAETYLS